jgi:hypothetical protein
MPPAKPPLSSLSSFVRCEEGDTLSPEQYRRLFAGGERAMQAFVQYLASLTQANPTPTGALTDDARERA